MKLLLFTEYGVAMGGGGVLGGGLGLLCISDEGLATPVDLTLIHGSHSSIKSSQKCGFTVQFRSKTKLFG